MKTVPLVETFDVTFDSNGNGTVYMAPNIYGTYWTVKRVSTTCTTPLTKQVTFQLYRNTLTDGMGGTYSGQNDSDDMDMEIGYGERLIGVYSGGNPGDTGSVTVVGTITNTRGR